MSDLVVVECDVLTFDLGEGRGSACHKHIKIPVSHEYKLVSAFPFHL